MGFLDLQEVGGSLAQDSAAVVQLPMDSGPPLILAILGYAMVGHLLVPY